MGLYVPTHVLNQSCPSGEPSSTPHAAVTSGCVAKQSMCPLYASSGSRSTMTCFTSGFV